MSRLARISRLGRIQRLGGGAAAEAPAYSPLDDSPYAWLDADLSPLYSDAGTTLVTADGASVLRIGDLSGNARHADAPGAGNRGTLQTNELNGMRSVQLDGVDDYYVCTSFALQSYAIVTVFKATANGLVFEHSVDANANDGCYLYTTTGQSILHNRGGVTSKDRAADWGIGGTWRIATLRHDAIDDAGFRLRVNGADQSMTNTALAGGVTSTTKDLFLGARSGAVAPLAGHLFALCVIAPYDAAAMARVEAYYATRTGIA